MLSLEMFILQIQVQLMGLNYGATVGKMKLLSDVGHVHV